MNIELLETRIAPAPVIGQLGWTAFAVDDSNNLVSFNITTPSTLSTPVPITGLQGTEQIEGLDFRPLDGELYALGIVDTAGDDTGRLYRINTSTGAATLIGAGPFSTTIPDGLRYGFDFDPVTDQARITNDLEANLRVDPRTGVAQADTLLLPVGGIVAAAYDRNFFNATATTLFGIDSTADTLVRIGGVDGAPSPDAGAVTTLFALGVNPNNLLGFDIVGQNQAVAAMDISNVAELRTIDLTTGQTTFVGNIGTGGTAIVGLAVHAVPQLVDATTAKFIDVDSDVVTVKTTQGTLGEADFTLRVGAPGDRAELVRLNLADDLLEFDGSSVTISVAKKPGGDGRTNVGHLDATGVDLVKVKVQGDLAQIDAGNVTLTTTALASLDLRSFGRFDAQLTPTSFISHIEGPVGTVKVAGDMHGAKLEVAGGANGTIGSVTIGGSLIGSSSAQSGQIEAEGDVGNVKIGGDIAGGAGFFSGQIDAKAGLGAVTVAGSLVGGSALEAGEIFSETGTTSVKIGRHLVGGAGESSALILSNGDIGPVTIGGSVFGGVGSFSGKIIANDGGIAFLKIGGDLIGGAGPGSGGVALDRSLKSMTIGGSLVGGAGSRSGKIATNDNASIDSLKIGRDLIGGAGTQSGGIESDGNLSVLTIGGSIFGGSANGAVELFASGSVRADQIGKVTIGGSIFAGFDNTSGDFGSNGAILARDDILSLTVKGSLIGNETNPVVIAARGQAVPGATDLAIAKLKIGGRVERAEILAGYLILNFADVLPEAVNGNASIGTVDVGRNWIASDLVAGVQNNATASLFDDGFGDGDDQLAPGASGLVASIAKITIKGLVIGTGAPGDHFGFVAEQIDVFKAGGITAPFTARPPTNVIELSPSTGDVTIREV